MNHKRIIKSTLAAGAIAMGMLAAGTMQAGATPITLNNPSFEDGNSPIVPHDVLGWSYTGYNQFTTSTNGWDGMTTAYGTNFVVFQPNYNQIVAFQDSAYTIREAGEVLTLTAAIGNASGQFLQTAADYTGLLNITLDDSIVSANVFSDTTVGAVGSFDGLATAYYTTTEDDIGKTLGVFLGGDGLSPYVGLGGQYSSEFDNIQLFTSAVPEPSTWAMLLGGAGLIVILRARRKLS